ncbi:hypothetical protein FQ186_07960 [Pseudomonas sp. ANT_H14]|uniref:hypothetical protein n=1 Tax=unclassified Pseudomonas TaxID=196821 RepID=UPI0011EFF772|nr:MULTISPECIES: hypothetical protein [unclassified Pseudomonas]KAA0948227.1 hypothetical protein FQ182_07305 [Pseudomonas sp. ANT_H4]KAA0953026.1 hypothetical protein FQ186_07960 [Pseudomonas sp. ANT_H14]
MNAISRPIVLTPDIEDARLTLPMQDLMARVLRDAQSHTLTQLMIVGVTRKVGASFITRQAASQLSMAFGSVLVIEVSATADEAEMLAGDIGRLRVPDHSAVQINLSTSSCLKLFGLGGSTSHGSLSERLHEHFDLVLWDMPSPTFAPVAIVAAKSMNGIILVAQANKTRHQAASYVSQRLQESGGKILGVVLNRTLNFIPGWLYRWL